MAAMALKQRGAAAAREFAAAAAVHEDSETWSGKKKGQWPWQLKLWKSRLPVVVVPVLGSLRSLSDPSKLTGAIGDDLASQTTGTIAGLSQQVSLPLEFALLLSIAGFTGYMRMPFSVTWWLILMAACVLESDLLIGVATLVSLTTLLGWYGIRVMHPHATMALWGGARRSSAAPKDSFTRFCWQVWDIVVHLMPGLLMLYWYLPAMLTGPGTAVGFASALAALPLNVVWLWFLGLGKRSDPDESKSWLARRHIWPVGFELASTNAAYNIEPPLPSTAWEWAYGSHWVACGMVAGYLGLPSDVAVAYLIFFLHGLLWQPYTTAWWIVWLTSLFCPWVGPMFCGIVACCGATTAIGWYGVQFLVPTALESLVGLWLYDPAERFVPAWLYSRMSEFRKHPMSMRAAQFADLCLHFFPTLTAIYIYRQHITSGAALAALPSNILYLLASRTTRLADTNRIYGVTPEPPTYVWTYVYGSHLVTCVLVLAGCLVSDLSTTATVQATPLAA